VRGRANPAAKIDFQRLDASDSNDFRTFASISVLDWTDFRFKFYPQCVIFMSSGTFCSQRAKHMRYCSCVSSSFHHSHTFRGRGKHFHHLQKAPSFQMVFARQFKQKLCETREGLVLRSLTLVILSVSWIHLQKLYRGPTIRSIRYQEYSIIPRTFRWFLRLWPADSRVAYSDASCSNRPKREFYKLGLLSTVTHRRYNYRINLITTFKC